MDWTETWELDDTGLTPDTPIRTLMGYTPYTTTEDKKGHEVFLGAKFPKNFSRWVTEMKEASSGTYRTNADVVRDAVQLGLLIIALRAKYSERWHAQSRLTQIKAELFDDARVYRDCDEAVEDTATLVDHGDVETAKKVLKAFKDSLASYPPKYDKALEKALNDKRLGYLLEE